MGHGKHHVGPSHSTTWDQLLTMLPRRDCSALHFRKSCRSAPMWWKATGRMAPMVPKWTPRPVASSELLKQCRELELERLTWNRSEDRARRALCMTGGRGRVKLYLQAKPKGIYHCTDRHTERSSWGWRNITPSGKTEMQGKTAHKSQFKKTTDWVEDLAERHSASLASTRSWVQFRVPKKKTTQKQTKLLIS